MAKTIFERIIHREIPSEVVYEDEQCIAFRDVKPAAPVHVLVVPKKPVPSLDHLAAEDEALLGHLWLVIPKVAAQLGLAAGYRVAVNCGEDGGQTVPHLHFHVLGGRPLSWPPG